MPETRKTTPKTGVRRTARTRGKAPRRTAARQSRSRAGQIAFSVLVFLAVLAVAFFIWARTQGELSVTENAVGSLLSPVQNALNSAATWMRSFAQDIRDRGAIKTQNEELTLENMTLQYRVSQLEEAERENERLKALLSAQSAYEELSPIYARVIAKDAGPWFDTFSINRGQLSGVTVGMAVVTGDGLVGRVYEAGLNYAKVMSVIDSRSSIACLIERTRDNGVLTGQLSAAGSDVLCNMYYLPTVNSVVPGDTVITSGLDGMFPKGLMVGTVAEVSRQADSAARYIVVSPLVDFNHIEEVLVLRTVIETDQEQALPAVPTPTPRPTMTPDPNATPSPEPDETSGPSSAPDEWSYPTQIPDGVSTIHSGGTMPEDVWAEK